MNAPRSISHLKVGQKVRVGYRSWVPTENSTLIGWKVEGNEELRMGYKDVFDRETLRAVFRDKDGMTWEAYCFNKRWCIGSSADTAKLYPPIMEN